MLVKEAHDALCISGSFRAKPISAIELMFRCNNYALQTSSLDTSSLTGESFALLLSQLSGNVEMLIQSNLSGAYSEFVARSLRWASSRALITIYRWYMQVGPLLSSDLIDAHRNGTLHTSFPHFERLVNHIVLFVTAEQSRKNSTVTSDANSYASLSSDLHGLRSTSVHTEVTLPSIGKGKSIPVLSKKCLLDLLSREFIVKPYKPYKTTLFGIHSDDIESRLICSGAVLFSIYTAMHCSDDILSSSALPPVLIRSTTLFHAKYQNKPNRIANALMKDELAVLLPLQNWIHDCLSDDNYHITKELGNVTWKVMQSISNGRMPAKSKSSAKRPAVVPFSRAPVGIASASVVSSSTSHNQIVLQPGVCQPRFHLIACILRDILNIARGRHAVSPPIRNILAATNPFNSSKTLGLRDVDHYNPLRHSNIHAATMRSLLGPYITQPHGGQILFMLLGTGCGGSMTKRFTDDLDLSSFDEDNCISYYVNAWARHDPTYVFDNGNCWGTWSTTYVIGGEKLTRDELSEDDFRKAVQDRFAPLFERSRTNRVIHIDRWNSFLGAALAGVSIDAITDAQKLSWESAFDFAQDSGFAGFGKGALGKMQFANTLYCLGLVKAPRLVTISSVVSDNNKGAAIGLDLLGFDVSTPSHVNSAIRFTYAFLDIHLSQVNKRLLDFGPIFFEHFACKLHRFSNAFKVLNPSVFRNFCAACISDHPMNNWVQGADNTDPRAYPLPLYDPSMAQAIFNHPLPD